MITHIIFDLWDTLGKKNASFSSALAQEFSITFTPELYAKYEASMQLKKWDSMEEMARSFLSAFEIEVTSEHVQFVCSAQREVLAKATPLPQTRAVLESLKKKYTIILLSNATCYEAQIIKQWGFEKLFDKEIFPFDTKLLKPSEHAFFHACEVVGVNAGNCLFIDDNRHNCAAAESVGMHALQFKNSETLLVQLRHQGLLE